MRPLGVLLSLLSTDDCTGNPWLDNSFTARARADQELSVPLYSDSSSVPFLSGLDIYQFQYAFFYTHLFFGLIAEHHGCPAGSRV